MGNVDEPGGRVRVRQPADLVACVEALRGSHEVDRYPWGWPSDPVAWLSPPATLQAWVADDGAAVVGHVVLVAGAPGWASVSRLFVAPPAQHRGLAVELLEALVDEAGGRGLSVELDVVEDSAAAIALYERLGWTLVAREPAPFTWPDGTRPRQRRYVAPRADLVGE